MSTQGTATTIWDRTRGWLYFMVDDPYAAAKAVSSLFTQGGDEYVIIRADVVEGRGFNLVVPVDAMKSKWNTAVTEVQRVVGAMPANVATVVAFNPEPTHQAHCFITEEEHRRFPLHEYYPPGRHPKSPGANPWG
jgi:hypothetical protein